MQPLVQQGIDAYNAGNKAEAVRLLTQAARENKNDEMAWYYLGLSLDDEPRKRRCFQQVLALNPDNQQAKNELVRLDSLAAASSSGPAANTAPQFSTASGTSGQSFKNPIMVEGAPPNLTIPYIIDTTRQRVQQGISIYTTRDMDYYVQAAQGASMWDSVFMVTIAAIAAGAAQLFGRLIGFFFGGFFQGVIGGLILSPVIYAIAAVVGTFAGFFAGVYLADAYLKNEKANIPIAQQAMYYALLFLPLTLISAGLSFIVNAAGFLLLCLLPLLLPAIIVIAFYNWYLLRQAMGRVYNLIGNKAWIAAGIAIFGGLLTSSILQSIITGIFRR